MYSKSSSSYSAECAAQLLFNCAQSEVCTKQPIGCIRSATFIIDTTKLGHQEDVRADDLGVWHNKGVRTNFFRIDFAKTGKLKHVTNLGNKPPVHKSESVYSLKRTYSGSTVRINSFHVA